MLGDVLVGAEELTKVSLGIAILVHIAIVLSHAVAAVEVIPVVAVAIIGVVVAVSIIRGIAVHVAIIAATLIASFLAQEGIGVLR